MAFEDRSSPNTATRPNSKNNAANSPESSRTTLRTTNNNNYTNNNNNIEMKTDSLDFSSHTKTLKMIENENSAFFKIASFAVRNYRHLTSPEAAVELDNRKNEEDVKIDVDVDVEVDVDEDIDVDEDRDNDIDADDNQDEESISSFDTASNCSIHNNNNSPSNSNSNINNNNNSNLNRNCNQSLNERNVHNNSANSTQSPSLLFSIQKILQPDFGNSAISRTKKDKISFKPYEDSAKKPQLPPPLGSLCETVSLLGTQQSNQHRSQSISTTTSQQSSIFFGSKKSDLNSPTIATKVIQSLSNNGNTANPKKSSVAALAGSTLSSTTSTVTTASAIDEKLAKKNMDTSLLKTADDSKLPTVWPAWVYCTRYSDRPSSGPRSRRMKKSAETTIAEEKRPRTAFSSAQLARLKHEFAENRYLTEKRRQQLSNELGLNEAQIKIWFQNKRAKIKKSSGNKNPLALQLMAQGLYNHSTVPCDEDDMPLE